MTLVQPTLVCLAPHFPAPTASHAGAVLLHARLAALSATHEVTCIVPDTRENRRMTAEDVGFRVRVVVADPSPVRLRALRRLVPALRGDLDVFVPQIRRALSGDPEVSGLMSRAAVVEVHWGEYAGLLPLVRRLSPTAVLGLFLHDVVTSARRARAAMPGVRLQERLVYVASQVPAERREVRLCDSADVVWVLKAADVLHLRQRGVRTSIEVAQPWLDRRPLAPPSGRRLPVAVFVAALWREENATAAAWVVDQVWPTVHDAVPDAELRLAGARPPSWLERRVADEPGVVLTGFVEDLLSEYSRATVSLAPLADPSGLKIKVVQAMMHGLPVVARPAAVAGVADAPSDALGGVSDDPDRFAAHLVRLLRDPVLAASVGARAATWARDRFDFEEDIGTAVARYEQLGQSRQGRTSTS